ncbi:multifunctional CCA addition/repair protein [Pseudomonas entomophila]|uniref:multifunctional CCA addition/repair protein n=1 Tax=Pseudomonas entomophila TaxID=312306 RepID=UPI0015E28341|nr:multifunctional CCA addition/repair protein [Pseudomonas entomophila]MBA1188790.1 multifunctional CCA addition/repair protein [Pseudomonas entomophila]
MHIYKVGGAVRDRLLGLPVSDIDWLVVGASVEQMQALGYRPVGADFPVFLHPETGEEYALARTERKSGRGYGGFTFHASPDVTLEQDLIRRDLTINAMAEDQQGNLHDPYHGRQDLEQRWLRHVSPAFAEDPLRVLRVARFAARYAPLGFRIADETLALMRQIGDSGELHALTAERSWKEIERALMEAQPQVFIQVLRDCGALVHLMPEVDALFEPVASRGQRTLAVLAQAARDEQPLPVRWACLLHDIGRTDPDAPDQTDLSAIDAVSRRFKVPRECQELAALVAQFQGEGHRALTLSAAALLEMLQRFDVYRRPQRFEAFIAACQTQARAAADSGSKDYAPGDYLRGAAAAARAVQARPLVERGLTGPALGEAVKAERLAALEAFRRAHGEA